MAEAAFEGKKPALPWITVFVGAAVLGVGAALCAATAQPWSAALLVAVAAVGVAPIYRAFRTRGDVLAPPLLFGFLTLLYYVYRPVTLLAGAPPMIPGLATENLALPLALVLVHTLMFYAGYSLSTGDIARRLPVGSLHWSPWRLAVAAGAIIVFSSACWIIFLREVGGWSYWLANLHYAVHTLREGRGAYFLGASLIGLAFNLVFTCALVQRVPWWAVAATGIIAAPVLMSLGERGPFVTMVVMALVAWHYLRRPFSWRAMAMLGGALIVVFVGFGLFREYTVERQEGFARAVLAERLSTAQVLSLNAFDMFTRIVQRTPDLADYQLHRPLWALPASFIPSALLPEKPPMVHVWVNDIYRGEWRRNTMAISLPGEGYVSFQVPGIILWGFFFGLFWRLAYDYQKNNPGNPSANLLYALLISMFFSLFRGGVLGFAGMVLVVRLVAFVVLIVWLTGGKCIRRGEKSAA